MPIGECLLHVVPRDPVNQSRLGERRAPVVDIVAGLAAVASEHVVALGSDTLERGAVPMAPDGGRAIVIADERDPNLADPAARALGDLAHSFLPSSIAAFSNARSASRFGDGVPYSSS